MLRAIFGFLALVGSLSAACAGPAELSLYGTPAEARWAPFHSTLPACDDSGVLSTITGRFAETENTYWGGVHAIESYDRVREIGFRSNGLSYIPRRYCIARALMIDPQVPPDDRARRERTVVYSVVAAGGIIGWTWGVEWCVVGLDRMHAYAPDCYVLKPIIERRIGELRQMSWLEAYGLKARY
jgi:hypothetical protein